MTAPTSFYWLHVGKVQCLQHTALPPITRADAEVYGKAAIAEMGDTWLLSQPQQKRDEYASGDQAAAFAERLRGKK